MNETKTSEANKVELLHMVSRLAAVAEDAETRLAEAITKVEELQKGTNYWISELNKSQARVKDLEQQVANLSTPIADLLRAGKEMP